MSTRVIYRRGKKAEIEQLDNVVALPASEQQDDLLGASTAAPDILNDEAQTGVAPSDINAFRRAGWKIVAAEQSDAVAGVVVGEPGAPVFLDRSQGRLMIGTKRLAVKFTAETSPEDANSRLAKSGVTVLRELRFSKNLYHVEVPAGQDPLTVAETLQNDTAVEYAEPEMIENLPTRLRPSDPQYGRQWQWHNDGSVGGTANADVGTEIAWDSGRGNGVRVAVIDNGFDVDHPDLTDAIDSASGYFLKKANGDAEFEATLNGFPDENHGTFCAGMVGARADNAQGGCGAAPEATLLLVACLTDQVGSQVTLARAVAYAADPRSEFPGVTTPGADIIACSLGPNNAPWALTSVMDDALNFAATQGRGGKGTVIFWAVDNAPNPVVNDEVCSHEKTIAVGRSTRNDRENGSAFGPELDFLAPGVDVFSTTSGGSYGSSTGTSYAAPCAAGVAALVLGANAAATAAEVRKILTDTCKKIGGPTVKYVNGRNDRYGAGRIDASRAVALAGGPADEGEQADEPMPAPAGPAIVGPQLPPTQGRGEHQWTAPSILTVQLEPGTDRDLEVSVIDGRAVFEGDIVLTRGMESLGIGVIAALGRRWPGGVVVYDIQATLPNPNRVLEAIAKWEAANAGITFRKKKTGDKDYVFFREGGGCSSAVGKMGGVQFITLAAGCAVGNVTHEIGHAIGLWHEQSRHDRNSKVAIMWENIAPDAHHNFRQQLQDGEDIDSYDYHSIMHYGPTAFSINGLPTIVPNENAAIGQRESLSPGDIAAVKKMYGVA